MPEKISMPNNEPNREDSKMKALAYEVNGEKKYGIHYGDAGRENLPEGGKNSRFAYLAKRIEYANTLLGKNKGELSPEDEKLLRQKENFEEFLKAGGNILDLVEFFRHELKRAVLVNAYFETNDREIQKKAEEILDAETRPRHGEKDKDTGKDQQIMATMSLLRSKSALEAQNMIDDFGPFLEMEHRKYIREKIKTGEFLAKQRKIAEIKAQLELENRTSDYLAKQGDILENEKVKGVARRLRQIFQEESIMGLAKNKEVVKFALENDPIARKNPEFLLDSVESIVSEEGESLDLLSPEELKGRIEKENREAADLWEDEIVRYFAKQNLIKNLVRQDLDGERSLELPSIARVLNQIAVQEARQKKNRTCVAAVLIGPPGTGKSTIAEHYFSTHPEHKNKPKPVRFTMTKETTQYELWGGVKIDVRDETRMIEMLGEIFKSKDPEREAEADNLITAFIANSHRLREDLKRGAKIDPDSVLNTASLSDGAREFVKRKIQNALDSWKINEMEKLMYGNDWRMGVIMRALAEGRDIIIDEYNNFKTQPDELRDLLETPIGGVWKHPKSGKEFIVNSSIILTANVGVKAAHLDYGANILTAALKNRLLPPIEMAELPVEEEMLAAQVKLTNELGDFLLKKDLEIPIKRIGAAEDKEAVLKVNEQEIFVYLFEKVLPRLHKLAHTEGRKKIPTISLRNIDAFARELVDSEGRMRRDVSVEDAFAKHFLEHFRSEGWEVLVNSGIVEDMYRDGLLHGKDPHSPSHQIIRQVAAERLGESVKLAQSGIGEREEIISGRQEIENQLSVWDDELIEAIKESYGANNWIKLINREGKKVVLENIIFSKLGLMPKMSTFDKDDEYVSVFYKKAA